LLNIHQALQLFKQEPARHPFQERKEISMEKKRIATLFLIVLADMMGGSAIVPILPVFVVGQFHANPFQASLVITAFYIAQVGASPVLGNLSDRFGRRPILLLSQAGTIASYLLIVLAVPFGALLDHLGLPVGIAGGLLIIYLARLLDGATGGNVSVAQAYASDVSTPEERTRVLGLIGGAGGVGHVFGPALTGLLASISLLTPFWGAAVISVVTLLLMLLWLREPRKQVEVAEKQERVPLSSLLRSRPVVLILSRVFLMGLFMAAILGTIALYADRVLLPGQPEKLVVGVVGAMATVIGLVTILVQIVLLKPVVSRLGEYKAVLLGATLLLVSAVGFFSFSSLWAFIAFLVVFAFGMGIVSPTLQSLLTRSGPPQMAGQLLGLNQAMLSLSLILGPVLGGWLFEAVAPQAVFAAGAGLMVLTLVLSIGMPRLPYAASPAHAQGERAHMHS
jgi:DHA1 family tetracycline resistance protein-like MFS transporter